MANQQHKELKMTRELDAPLEEVWKAWTDQSLIKKWWGPRGVTNLTCKWDARPGGAINIVMLAGKELGSLAGQKWPMVGEFQEVKPKRRLVYTASALDDVKDILLEAKTIVDFEDLDEKTKLKIHIAVTKANPKADPALAGMETGWEQQIDKLNEALQMSK